MNNKQSTILTILILLITVTNGLSIAEPVLAFIPTIATGAPTLSSTLVTVQNVTSTVTATVTRLASTAAPTAAVPSATPTRTATKTSTSVVTSTVVTTATQTSTPTPTKTSVATAIATATPTDDNTEVIIDLTLGTPPPPITSLDNPTPTPKAVPTYFSFPWSVFKPKPGTSRNAIITATPQHRLASAKATPTVVAKTGTPVTTPLPRSTHVSVPSGSTPTRIAMAQGNPDIQIIESQTSDTIDTTEQGQQDSSYFVRQLAKVGIIFVIGGLLLGSGVLSITALFFVWRTYFR